jgi:hypothetical protein
MEAVMGEIDRAWSRVAEISLVRLVEVNLDVMPWLIRLRPPTPEDFEALGGHGIIFVERAGAADREATATIEEPMPTADAVVDRFVDGEALRRAQPHIADVLARIALAGALGIPTPTDAPFAVKRNARAYAAWIAHLSGLSLERIRSMGAKDMARCCRAVEQLLAAPRTSAAA